MLQELFENLLRMAMSRDKMEKEYNYKIKERVVQEEEES